MKVSNKAYDIIKTIALIVAPATTLFAAIAEIWGIPYGTQIVATLAALDTFLGALVVILKSQYDKTLKGGES